MALRKIVITKPAVRPSTAPKITSTIGPRSGPLTRPKPGVSSKPATTDEQRTSDGFARSRQERERGNALMERLRARPLNFFLKPGGKARVIILDAQPYFFYEHRWQGPEGKWNRMESCLKEDGKPCAACQKLGKAPTWVMALTIIDTRPYTKKDGTVVKRSRKIMLVKGNVLDKYDRWYQKNGKSFRGAVFDVFRSTQNKAPNAGDDFEQAEDKGAKVRLTEAQIATYGKDLTQLTDYEKAYKPLEPEMLEYVLGSKGSKAVGAEELEEEPADDQIPF